MKKQTVILAVMDGIGLTDEIIGNAVLNANTKNLDYLMKNHPFTTLNAHGTYVGLPSDDDMGNSEVGHNALGCGQIYAQGAKLVNISIENKDLYKGDVWTNIKNTITNNNTLHLIGLLSDGNVHSHIDHLFSLIKQAKQDNIKNVSIHILLDGRDVSFQSSTKYVQDLEDLLISLNDETFNAKIASGGGRMLVTMDRYDADWNMVNIGWKTHVLGDAKLFNSATDAINHYREIDPNISDQYMPPFVIGKDKAISPIVDDDHVIFFNFRGDRAIEISKAFETKDNFDKFDRVRVPKVNYVGMLQYDGDLLIPKKFLVDPPSISNTLTEVLNKHNLKTLAISETQKFGHVTYFWNGNKLEKFDENLEDWVEINGVNKDFEIYPEMKAKEITDYVIDSLNKDYSFIRLNYPNGDMVGHTGDYNASVKAVEVVDHEIGRLMDAALKHDAILIVLADHGNSDEMLDKEGIIKTSHTLNKVPFIIYNKDVVLKQDDNLGLSNVAATITDLLNIEPDIKWDESIIIK